MMETQFAKDEGQKCGVNNNYDFRRNFTSSIIWIFRGWRMEV